MNCKPGDLAVCIHSTQGNEGAILRVLAAAPALLRGGYGPVWRIEWTRPPKGDAIFPNHMPDAWLRPIRDPGEDATDETLLWTPVPNKQEQPA